MGESYFLLPKELFRKGLDHMAIAVFVFLRSREAVPSISSRRLSLSRIGKIVSLSENSVRKSLRHLRESGLLFEEHTVFFGADPVRCRGRYFFLPFRLLSLGLTSKELAVYAYLMYLEDRSTNQCWPSYRTIARATGIKSTNTVSKVVRRLEERELIFTEPTVLPWRDGSVRNGNLRYTVRPLDDAIEHHHREQLRQLNHAAETARLRRKLEAVIAEKPALAASVTLS